MRDLDGVSSSNEDDVTESILEHIGHYWTDDRCNYTCEQSKLYAEQKSIPLDCVSRNNLSVFRYPYYF